MQPGIVQLSIILVATSVAPAQIAPPKFGDLVVRGSIRTRLEVWDWFRSKSEDQNKYVFSGNVLRIKLSGGGNRLDWNLELEAPVLAGLPDRAVLPAPQLQLGLGGNYFAANNHSQHAASIFAKQAFARYNRGVFQVDGWGNLKIGVLYAAVSGQARKKTQGRLEGFGNDVSGLAGDRQDR